MTFPGFSDEEIVALRRTGIAADGRFVNWAVDALGQGRDSPGLRILAGETPPFSHFEMQSLVDRTFCELGLTDPQTVEDALSVLARRLARFVLAGDVDRGAALVELRTYYLQFDVPDVLDFYLLHHALADLQSGSQQWYWPGADRSNIDRVIDDRFRALLDAVV
ncbi:MAG: hypothetical protein AB7T19_17850 [Planctomycetota bacterium]